jgi:sterol desaturase/sphingolipid hydroxylase (fatty acid hydroxylase superfamily)
MAKQYVSNKDETVRLFKSDFVEFFSRVHWSIPLFVFVPVVFYFTYEALAVMQFSIPGFAAWFIAGLVVWTATEYFLHRFVFHFKPWGPVTERIHFLFHGVHHDYPMDSKRLVMPPALSIPLAFLFYFLYASIFRSYVTPLFAGFITGYLCYDMTHYAIHHYNVHSPFWLAIKNHHVKHHFQDPTKGFGVSSPIWDYILHTNFVAGRKGERMIEIPQD